MQSCFESIGGFGNRFMNAEGRRDLPAPRFQ